MSEVFSIKNCKHALILGAGDIGSAMVRELGRQNPSCRIFATKRVSSPTPEDLPESARIIELDPTSDRSWKYLVDTLQEETERLDLIVSTFGLLHNDHLQPEKKLEDISMEGLKESFSINAFTAALAGKHLLPFLSREHVCVFSFLSAQVGSIADDKIGGWYGYRASKAALNMIVKNMAIEFERRKLKAITLALHPGTTNSKLSRPFLKGVTHKIKEPEESAADLLRVIDMADFEASGHFENYDGSDLPY